MEIPFPTDGGVRNGRVCACCWSILSSTLARYSFSASTRNATSSTFSNRIMRALHERENGGARFVIKRTNSLTCRPKTFSFKTCATTLPRGTLTTSTYRYSQAKGFFPYKSMDSLDKLDATRLSPREAFDSSFKGTQLTEEEYDICRSTWRDEKIETFCEFLT